MLFTRKWSYTYHLLYITTITLSYTAPGLFIMSNMLSIAENATK